VIGIFRVVVKEIFLAVSLPLLASLLVAYTVIPLYASRVLSRTRSDRLSTGFHIGIIRKWHKTRVMEFFAVLLKSRLRSPGKTIVIMLFLFIITPVIVLVLTKSFSGPQEETQIPISIETPRGTNLPVTDQVVQQVEQLADSLKYIKQMTTNVAPENGRISLEFLNREERKNIPLDLTKISDELENQIQQKQFQRLSNATIRVGQSGGGSSSGFTGESGSMGGGMGGSAFGGEVGMGLAALFGSGNEIIRVKGYDETNMRFVVDDIIERLTLFPEVSRSSPRSNLRGGELELQVWGDKTELPLHNLTMQSVMEAVSSIRRQGQEMTTKLKDDEGEYIIRLRLKEVKKQTIDDVRAMNIPTTGEGEIPLQNVAKIMVDRGQSFINRVDQERQIEISYSFRSEYVPTDQVKKQVQQKVDAAIRSIILPLGFTLEIEHPGNPFSKIAGKIFWMGFYLMLCILAIAFESIILPFLIFFTVPLAIIGSLWLMLITGTSVQNPLSFMAIFILLGIAVNNGIILIDYTQILRKRHGFNRNRAILSASRARVRPILMTSITTILGVLPLAIWPGTGEDIWKPFAVALIGGLGFSTPLTLVYLPMIYLSFDEFFKVLFKKCGTPGAVIAFALNVCTVYFIWFIWLDSTIYKIVWTIFFLTVINAVLWNFYRFLDRRKHKIELGEDLKIDIRNLTKIYNEPNKFIKDWNKRARRIQLLKAKGLWKIEPADIIEGLIWKIPVMTFFLFMHYSFYQNYFHNRFWLFVLTASTYFLGKNILVSLWMLIKKKPLSENTSGIRRRLLLSSDIASVLLMFVYLHFMWKTHIGWTITWCSLWLFLWYAKSVTQRVYSKQINLDKLRGPLKRLRRLFYHLLLKIPIIGRKRFEVRALHNVNLTITNGMFGLLGPNGAGKSTLMRLLANLFYQSRGVIYFNGFKLSENRDFIQKYIGYLPQKFGLYGNFTAFNYLNFIALLNKWGSKEERHHLVDSVLRNVNLWDRRNDKIKTYSGGMKQRVGVAQALLNLPRIIIVDEPTAGLDPRERIRFRNMLAEMSRNRIVIFSTHIVEDISTSCRELAVLNKGKVLFNGTPEMMRQQASGKVWESLIDDELFKKVSKSLQVVLHIRDDSKVRIRFISAAPPQELEPKPVEPTLEDAYLVMLNAV
jgi:ABC-type multidrug transport system ATPase subunit/preprotein translocase subunit SecF